MASTRKLGTGRSGPRLAGMTVLLILALAFSALLAWQAVASASRHRAIAEQTMEDYAEFAAFVLASAVYREFGLQVLSAFNGLPPWNTPEAFAARALQSGCGADGFYFEYEPAKAVLRRSSGVISDRAEVQLRDTLVHSVQLLDEASWRFRLVLMDLGDSASGVFIAATSLPDGFGVRGFSTCLWQDSTFVQLMRQGSALPASLIGRNDPDSLYAVAVGDPRGIELYVSPVWYPSTFQGSARLGPEFGDLALQVTLNPDIAPDLIIGGLPPSRFPATVGLFALSAVLLVAAAMQLRREYKLIAARSEFVSSVSHELRTPLSQILIFTELLKLNRLRSDEERERSLDIIDKETRRLIRLVENVLQFSRSTPVREPIEKQLELETIVQATVDAFRPLAEARAVELEMEVPREIRVQGNRNALRQVLLNLLDNAVKYGPRKQTIRIEALQRDGQVEISVEDQGPGIAIPDREKIWDGFERLDREESTAVSGSGIGLSVVKSLVERMNGTVHVTDSITGGARFVVTLPAGFAEDADE